MGPALEQYAEHAIDLMVRRTRLQLTETCERAKKNYRPLGASFTEQPMRCIMPNGARLNFAYLERDSDAENYQGLATCGSTWRRQAPSRRRCLS